MSTNDMRRKISSNDEILLRQRHHLGETYQSIADRYGVHKTTVMRIVKKHEQATTSNATAQPIDSTALVKFHGNEFLIWLLQNRINYWDDYVRAVEESKQSNAPILGTNEDECRENIAKARAILTELKSPQSRQVKTDYQSGFQDALDQAATYVIDRCYDGKRHADAIRGLKTSPSKPLPFSEEDIKTVIEGLRSEEQHINVGNVTGEGDYLLPSTFKTAADLIEYFMATQPESVR